MISRLRHCIAACTTLLLVFVPALSQQSNQISTITPADIRNAPSRQQTQQALDATALVFIENKGQWDARAKFLLKSGGLDIWITDRGMVYDLHRSQTDQSRTNGTDHLLSNEALNSRPEPMTRSGHVVSISFEGASFTTAVRGTEQQAAYQNYFLGDVPSKWATNVRLFGGARIAGLYEGIDAVFYLDEGTPRYDLIVAPGANAAQVKMTINGSDTVRVGADGSLLIATTMGAVEQRGLYAYQNVGGQQRQVECRFVVSEDRTVSFALGSYDRTVPLVIDPLVYSTFLGGNGGEIGRSIAVDGSGNIYVTGYTQAVGTAFPTTSGAYNTEHNGGFYDVFVTKLDPSASGAAQLVYSTFLGGNGADIGTGIAIDGSGNIYVTGYTFDAATDFPTTYGAYHTGHNGDNDVFVTKLDPSASGSAQLVYSTFLGGDGSDQGTGIAIDSSGNIYVTGITQDAATNFPTTSGAYNTGHNGGSDVFVTKLHPSANGPAQLVFSTFLGGNGIDDGRGIAVDSSGNIYVTGYTEDATADFPTTSGAYDTRHNGGTDVFVANLDPSAIGTAQLVYSTFLGSNGGDIGSGIAVDGRGNIYVTGSTYNASTAFPTTSGALDTRHNGNYDTFVTKLDPSASGAAQLVYSTFLGSPSIDDGSGIAVDGSGNICVTGYTHDASTDFPTTSGAYDTGHNGNYDVFVTKLEPSPFSAAQLVYSTFLGGNGADMGRGIAIDGTGNIYVTGSTVKGTINFPTTSGAYGTTQNDSADVFVTKLTIPPVTVTVPSATSAVVETLSAVIIPNPVQADVVRIEITSPGGGPVSVRVLDLAGKQVLKEITVPAHSTGKLTAMLDVSPLVSGTYLVTLSGGSSSTSVSMSVSR